LFNNTLGDEIDIDSQSVRREGGVIKFWTRQKFAQAGQTSAILGYFELDCDRNTIQNLAGASYAANNKLLGTNGPKEITVISPNSIGQGFSNMLCPPK
jgi:hypothetical protein